MSPILKNNIRNLNHVTEIFEDFYNLSGLKLNLNKTVIIPIGSSRFGDYTEMIRNNTDFKVENNFKLLGYYIDNNLTELYKNEENILGKVRGIIKFWEKFDLSLIGRINIFKTYMLSQVSYRGTALPISDEFCKQFDKITNLFFKHGIKISDKKLYGSKNSNGLGVCKVRDYLTSLKSNLLLKNLNNNDDWAKILINNRSDNYNKISFDDKRELYETHPFSYDILKNLLKFKMAFLKHEDNVLNLRFFSDKETTYFFDNFHPNINNFSINSRRTHIRTISNIDIFKLVCKENLRIFNYDEMRQKLSWEMNINEFFHLRSTARAFLEKFGEKINNSYKKLDDFLKIKYSRSKKIREFLTISYNNTRGFISRLKNTTNAEIPSNEQVKNERQISNIVHVNYLSTFYRSEFSKFLDNSILYNAALNKIDPNIDPGCRYCKYTKNFPIPKETLAHLAHCNAFNEHFIEVTDATHFSINICNENIFLGNPIIPNDEKSIFGILLCIFVTTALKIRTLDHRAVSCIAKKVESDFQLCREISGFFDKLCKNVYKRKPDWELIKKTKPCLRNNFDDG